ncbi:ribosomal RNA small subunit methyltransferase A [Candidatus Micrarchaeota archaeon]|nr:ribosomal RNA small subunit methyltransferase A [Candidatus Micrarchaeota archaeon]
MRKFKKLGQVFLNNPKILENEVRLAQVEGKTVLEIGPGDGRLTQRILDCNPKKLIAIEKDTRFVELLKEKFSSDYRIEIVNADFLEYEIPEVDVIIGNIPYYISSPIIFKLKDLKFEHAVLMVQREFAEKMVAKPNDRNYGRLSVTSQIFFNVEYLRTVQKMSFSPIPKVDSALIRIKPTGVKLSKFEEDIIRNLFQHKNKTVKNALKDYGINDNRRVRTLTKEECLQIAAEVAL